MQTELETLASEEFCYLTTTGRVTGKPHEIEIWFALVPERRLLFVLSGGRDRSDWVKNLMAHPGVSIQISGNVVQGIARVIEGEADEPLARRLLVEKYERNPGSLERWGRESLPVAFDL